MAKSLRVIACKECGKLDIVDHNHGFVCDSCKIRIQETSKLESCIEIIERIMSAHWDMIACRCWVCTKGRELGCTPRDIYLPHEEDNDKRYPVPVDGWFYKDNNTYKEL